MKSAKTTTTHATAKQDNSFGSRQSEPGFFHEADVEESFFDECRSPLQCKLSVGEPNDPYEKEADQTADKVVQRLEVAKGDATAPGNSTVQPAQPMTGDQPMEEKLRREEEGKEKPKKIQRKPIFESDAQPEDDEIKRKESDGSAPSVSANVDRAIGESEGRGEPLSPDVNQSMSQAFGTNFSDVRIHNDSQAASLSQDLKAQAFTHGNDIYFNTGKYSTDNDSGKHLLAHELTHVVQQGKGGETSTTLSAQPMVQRAPNAPPPPPGTTTTAPTIDEGTAERQGSGFLIKLKDFPAKVYASNFIVEDGIEMPKEDRDTHQKDIWIKDTKATIDKFFNDFLTAKNLQTEPLLRLTLKKSPKASLMGTKEQIREEISIPFWDKGGSPLIHEVEHSVDFQILGNKKADDINNLILLDKPSNRQLGIENNVRINKRLKAILENYAVQFPELGSARAIKIRKDPNFKIIFANFVYDKVTDSLSLIAASNIKGVNTPYRQEHFELVKGEIPDGHFLIRTSSDRAGYILPYAPGGLEVGRFFMKTKTKGKMLESIFLKPIMNDGRNAFIKNTKDVSIENEDNRDHCFLTNSQKLAVRMREFIGVMDLRNFSKLVVDDPVIEPGFGLKVTGHVDTDISFLKENNINITFELEDGEFTVQATMSDITSFPKPFDVTYSSLFLKINSKDGVSLGGELQFVIKNLGKGQIKATQGLTAAQKFGIDGEFAFESKKFEGSKITFAYADRKWSIGGVIKVAEGTINGIKSASLTVEYGKEGPEIITAGGDIIPTIPNLEKIGAKAKIQPNGDFKITGDLDVKKLPGVKSGNIHVEVEKKATDYEFTLSGNAKPNIPGLPADVNSDIKFSYDSPTEIFTGELTFNYTKGKFSGDVTVGLTNAAVVKGEKQKTKGESMVLYGKGTLKIKLLDGKVEGELTITLKPDGNLFIGGSITVPDTSLMEKFHREEKLSFPALHIPLVGVPFVSIFLEIGGGVKVYFDWDPLVVGGSVTLEDTNIKNLGQAKFKVNIHADSKAAVGAGMEISAKVGAEAVVLEISGGVNGFAGLEVNGKIGAELNMDFDMEKGLVFKNLNAKIIVTPEAVFELKGVIGVYLNLFVTKVNIWEYTKQFARGSIDLSSLGGLKVLVPVKFDPDGKIILPEMKDVQIEKPDFGASKGKELMETLFNDKQKEKPNEEERVKNELRAKIKEDFRIMSAKASYDLYQYGPDVIKKVHAPEKLSFFMQQAVEEEIKNVEIERFNDFRAAVTSSDKPLDRKYADIDFQQTVLKQVDPQWFASLKEEVKRLDDAKKSKPNTQKKALIQTKPLAAGMVSNGNKPDIFLHSVTPTPVVRKTVVQLFGDGTPGNPGIELSEFESYSRLQADWFAEPTLAPKDREDLWKLLLLATENQGYVLSGADGLKLSELRPLTPLEWQNLKAFSRGCHSGSHTVRIASASAYTLAQRLSMGDTLLRLEAIIAPEVLELTVTEAQLKDINANPSILIQLWLYWQVFEPHLQQKDKVSSGSGDRNREFQLILDLLNAPFGVFRYLRLSGRIRNLHRFGTKILDRQLVNYEDTSHTKPLQLVLHSAHDPSGSFVGDIPILEALVLNPSTLVLIIEGADTLADITAEIPKLAATYGKPDGKGVNRIARVMISGHGETRNVSLAGTGAPAVGKSVSYPGEDLNLDDPVAAAATKDLIDALLKNLDPATAKIAFNGCLVGSNVVPPGTPAANIPAYLAAHPNMKTFVESRATALGLVMPPSLVQGARASLGTPDSMMDAGGNIELKFASDPDAFGTAAAYIASGKEPEGVLRSAVELAAIDPVAAANQLNIRKAKGAPPDDWWQVITLAFVEIALDGVAAGGPVNIGKLQILSEMVGTAFLCRWPSNFGIDVSSFVNHINNQAALATDVYAKIAATQDFTTTPDVLSKEMRVIVEQSRLMFGQPREADLIAFINGTLSITDLELIIDPFTLSKKSAGLFPVGGATPGKVRLAITWLRMDSTNKDVRKFLNGEISNTATGPKFSAAVKAELTAASIADREILQLLDRLGGAVGSKDKANAEITGDVINDAFVKSEPYVATVVLTIWALNVRKWPNMAGAPFAWLHPGDTVNVMGFVHNWAAVDINGKLGFVYKTKISAPPI